MTKIPDTMTSDGDRISQYQQHVTDMQSTAQLYDLLAALQDHTFRIKPEAQIAAYFQQHELHYEQDDDIDVLSRFLADEIAKREGNDRMQKLVETNIGRRSLERLIGQSTRTYATSLQELDSLERPLQQLGETLYTTLKVQGNTIAYVPRHCLPPLENIQGHLFYNVNDEKVIFGICGPFEEPRWDCWSGIQGYSGGYGIRVILEPMQPVRKKLFSPKVKAAPFGLKMTLVTPCELRSYDDYRKDRNFTNRSFLDNLKSQILGATKFSKFYAEYLKIVLSFPYLLERGLATRKKEIEDKVEDVLSSKSKMKGDKEIIALEEE